MTVSTATGKTALVDSVYDVPGWLWSEPATVDHAPPFKLPANGGFTFTCNWDNTTTDTVKFGESANDEMCFFWAYYYPSQGDEVCFHTDRGARRRRPLLPRQPLLLRAHGRDVASASIARPAQSIAPLVRATASAPATRT